MQAAPPATARPPPAADGSSGSSFARVLPAPPSSRPDYLVVSSARKPAGAAAHLAIAPPPAAASLSSSAAMACPEALHDSQLLEAVSNELPGCPVLHSLLYSHRSVVNDGPPPEESLAEVNDTIARWKAGETQKTMATLNRTLLHTLKEEQVEHTKDLARRDEDHERTILRIDRVAKAMEQRFEGSVAETTAVRPGTGDLTMVGNRQKWDDLKSKHTLENEALVATLAQLATDEASRRLCEARLECVTQSAKLQVSEKLQHCLLLSEEERERLAALYVFMDGKNRVLLAEDETAARSPILATEARHYETIQLSYQDATARALRYWRAQAMLQGLQTHAQASEHGLRFNVDYEQERTRLAMLADYQQANTVVSLVGSVVHQAAAGHSREAEAQPEAVVPPADDTDEFAGTDVPPPQ